MLPRAAGAPEGATSKRRARHPAGARERGKTRLSGEGWELLHGSL